ncbi:MAG TPA: alpha/beta hydrolase [Fimbriiglobus sp.]|jgi:endo-1,4-beta-xylanase
MWSRASAIALICSIPTLTLAADPPPLIHLWEKGAPGYEDRKDIKETRDHVNKTTGEYRMTNVHNPYVNAFIPTKEKSTGAALVIVPGGGHRELWPMAEGDFLGQWLADRGVACVILRYRLARENPKRDGYKIDVEATQDGQRALRLVRSKTKEWNVDPNRVGIMGFSAGGELAALVCRKADKGDPNAPDPIDRESAVPDYQALVYSGPLGIARQTITKANCPPTWIAIGEKDGQANLMITHFQAIRRAGISAELHIYANTDHAFGFRPNKTSRAVDSWPQRFLDWLGTIGMVKKTTSSTRARGSE